MTRLIAATVFLFAAIIAIGFNLGLAVALGSAALLLALR